MFRRKKKQYDILRTTVFEGGTVEQMNLIAEYASLVAGYMVLAYPENWEAEMTSRISALRQQINRLRTE